MKNIWFSIVVLCLSIALACSEFYRVQTAQELSLTKIERDQWKAESNSHYNQPR